MATRGRPPKNKSQNVENKNLLSPNKFKLVF